MSVTESALRPQEILTGGRINGAIVKAHIKWVRDYRGDAAVAKLLAMLPLESGMEISAARSSSWVSFESLILLDRAIEGLFGRGVRLFQRELGRYSAHMNLTGSIGPFRADDLHRFLRCSAVLQAKFQDFGTVSYRQTAPNGGEMIHSDYPCFSSIYCQSALGYYERAMTLVGK